MERSYCNHPVTRKYPWHKHNRNITMTLLKLDEISDIIVTWVYPSHVYSNVLQYNTIQPYCPCKDIPLAAIWIRRNVKHHVNMIYLRLQQNNPPTHTHTHTHKPPTQEKHVKTEIRFERKRKKEEFTYDIIIGTYLWHTLEDAVATL